MTDKEKKILEVLKNSEEALSAKEIAVKMYGPESTQQLVYSKLLKLEAMGYVQKHYSKRSYKFIVTSEGNTVKVDDTLNNTDTSTYTRDERTYNNKTTNNTSRITPRRKEYDVYERENFLKLQFNEVWSSILKEKKDYYSYMDEHSLDLLKNAVTNLKDINRLKTTLSFISRIGDIFNVGAREVSAIEEIVRTTPPHYGGYDIEYKGAINILAEIKCNMPINNSNKFEPVQISELKSELENLILGKEKSKVKDIENYCRFLVIKKHGKNIRYAVEELIKELPIEISKFLLVYREGMIISKDYVYIYVLEK